MTVRRLHGVPLDPTALDPWRFDPTSWPQPEDPAPLPLPAAPSAQPRRLLLGFGGDELVEATPRQRQRLIDKICQWYGKTETEALETLYAMSNGERKRMLMDAHERDDTTDPGDRYHEGGYQEPAYRPIDDGWSKLWPHR
jgi:hypothetical protein